MSRKAKQRMQKRIEEVRWSNIRWANHLAHVEWQKERLKEIEQELDEYSELPWHVRLITKRPAISLSTGKSSERRYSITT